MSKPLTIDELVSIYKLMQSILLAAETGDWQAVGELDAQRRELVLKNENDVQLNQQKTTDLSAASQQAKIIYKAQCDEIKILDAKITKTVLDAKEQLVIENRNMRNQIGAQKSYAQTAIMSRSF